MKTKNMQIYRDLQNNWDLVQFEEKIDRKYMYIRNFQMCDWSIKENIRVNEPSYQNEKFLLFDNGIIKVRRIFYHM